MLWWLDLLGCVGKDEALLVARLVHLGVRLHEVWQVFDVDLDLHTVLLDFFLLLDNGWLALCFGLRFAGIYLLLRDDVLQLIE